MFQFDKCCRPSGESKSDRKLRSRYLRNAPYKKERKNDINLRRSINNDDIEIYFKIQKKTKQTGHVVVVVVSIVIRLLFGDVPEKTCARNKPKKKC